MYSATLVKPDISRTVKNWFEMKKQLLLQFLILISNYKYLITRKKYFVILKKTPYFYVEIEALFYNYFLNLFI